MNPNVDDFLQREERWKNEISMLRRILLDCMLTEEYKWKQPCYTFQQKNVAILGGFKEFCVLSFFKGALLSDSDNLLEKQGENSQSGRILRFKNVEQIIAVESSIRNYIFEAIEIERTGIKMPARAPEDLIFVDELLEKLEANPILKKAFYALTPGRQRAYNMFITASKQPNTRYARINKYTKRILDGKGMNDCVCGLSKKMPGCDGSHKVLNEKV
jgi:uncharacterized protein YdeI (YjbR/CyaY-like superfamily)